MIRLLRVELLRLRWRRAFLILAAAAILVPALIGAAIAWHTRPLSGAEQQLISEQVQQATDSDPGAKRRYEKSLQNPQRFGADQGDPRARCSQFFLPQPEWFGGRPKLNLAQEVDSSAPGVIIIATMLALIVGTTFAGHDWNTGSTTNQLPFEARRLSVWAAKALAVLLVSTVVAATGVALFWLVLRVTASSLGLPVSSHAMHLIVTQGGRGVALAAVAGLGGYALTMLFRSTVGTLGILFGLSVIVPILLAVTGPARLRTVAPYQQHRCLYPGARHLHEHLPVDLRPPHRGRLPGHHHAGRGGGVPRGWAGACRRPVGTVVPPPRRDLTGVAAPSGPA